jgi:hypothetical protein
VQIAKPEKERAMPTTTTTTTTTDGHNKHGELHM